MPPHAKERSLLIDGLKALASVLIVLHHLAFYGPMTDHLRPYAPRIAAWFADDARLAVQVFLVIAGFLAARSLAPGGRLDCAPLGRILWHRFLRLALPYHAILLIAVACNGIASSLMTHDSISAPASLGQLIAHALLLQDLLGYEALSAGLWYVAMDMQLFLLMAMLLWLGGAADQALRRRHRWTSGTPVALVTLVGLSSLCYFNRDFAWDAWVLYFFGIYALGALAWWLSGYAHPLPWLAVLALGTAGTLLSGFRGGVLLALLVALTLAGLAVAGRRESPLAPGPLRLPEGVARTIRRFGGISYALFLVHFPVCLVVNAAFTRFAPLSLPWQSLGIVAALALSVAAAAAFHRGVEAPLHRWVRHKAVVAPPAQA